MLVFHGLWADGAACLWAEDSALPAAAPPRPGRPSRAPRPHPFAVDAPGLALALAELPEPAADLARKAVDDELTLWLPSLPDGPLASPELVRQPEGSAPDDGQREPGAGQREPGAGQAGADAGRRAPGRARRGVLAAWRVPALAFEPGAAVELLAVLGEPGAFSGQAVAGGSARYLAAIARLAADLPGRGRVLPSLRGPGTGGDGYAARWRPVLTGPDAERARELAAGMPAVCRAASADGEPAAALFTDALDAFADAATRAVLAPAPLLPPRRGRRPARLPVAERWLAALTAADPMLEIGTAEDEQEATELAAQLDDWHTAAQLPAGPVRTCFRLIEPEHAGDEAIGPGRVASALDQIVPAPDRAAPASDDDAAAPDRDAAEWRVEFALQSTEDPSLLMPAADVWAGASTIGLAAGIQHPEEELLAGLGRAVRLFPELDAALRTAAPAGVSLDTEGAFGFLRQSAPLLSGAGFGVLLPDWARKSRLGLKLTTRSRATSSGSVTDPRFGMNDLVEFRYDLALGDQELDPDDLAELARLKVPLVRLRGQWVELDDRHLKAALKFLERNRSGTLSAGDALLAGLRGPDGDLADDELPLVAVDADGWLGDLLSGQADRRLEPVSTPPGFTGELRPYQERGVAWMSFLSSLGLGGILADHMGLGKCTGPRSPVFVNGSIMAAEDIWARFATRSWSDGEGEWAAPSRPLVTNALGRSGPHTIMMPAAITRLYRQRVSEKLRTVRLDDGSEILITRRHRLLGPHDWTREFAPGDRICVPARLTWTGVPVDPDLTVLLAWQIAEGREGRSRVGITQKGVGVLRELQSRAVRVADTFGINLNAPTIRKDRGRTTSVLTISSVAYREFLTELGYTWGKSSAEKRIPDFIVAADDATIRTFLREYFSAEGSVLDGMRSVEISSASQWLMRQLACMLRRFGIWLRITEKRERAVNGSGIYRPCWVGLIGGSSLRRFHESIGFSDASKQAKLAGLCIQVSNTSVEGVPGSGLLALARSSTRLPTSHFGLGPVYFTGSQQLSNATATTTVTPERAQREVFYAKVVSVEEVDYTGWVYDFEVAGHHNYVAGGMLCHNTVQLLGVMAHERDVAGKAVPHSPTLLVCPMSVVGNWEHEAARFTPALRVHVHHGADRLTGDELTAALNAADLVITTYGVATRDREALGRVTWARVVCDEAQNIKNHATRQAQAVRALPAASRVALTGTPVENRLSDLWSIMEFTNPGLLGPAEKFRQRFAIPIERGGDEDAAERLRRITGPFVLRRLKTDKSIISDLPDKLEMKVWCNLTAEQASLYQATVTDMLARIEAADEGIERRGLVLATMAKLKQVCNHPAHLLGDGSRLPGRSGKLARLEEICDEIVAEGDKALCFTQYAEFGSMLQPHLAARLGCPVLYLHGGTPKKQRDTMVAGFQQMTEPAVFLLSLKAGGTGLNLTAASHVIHVDRWWNPAVEDQATDRAFRIGQRKDVQVRKFVCVGTLEERIDAMIEEKKALAERIVGTGESWLTELSVAELRDVIALAPEAVSE